MSGVVWTKFYWSDWQSDPALRLCSYAARGLWMDLLCIAAAHDPIGYVAVAGRALDETAIARMTGGLESEVRDLLGELDRNGVFSRDRQGRIYSRRMTDDAKKAAIARKNGKTGGNPKLRNGEGNSSSDNPPDKSPLKPQEPRASSHKSERTKPDGLDTRATRLPDDWLPTAPDLEYAASRGFGAVRLERMIERFRNYWHAKAGKDARRVSWSKTWQNWVLSELERQPQVVHPPKRVGFV